MRNFVIGDVHGAYQALKQCFERAAFDSDNDQLIFLGDISDGWPEVPECVEELRKIKNLILLKGNHDLWFLDWLEYDKKPDIWLRQGGQTTIRSYEEREDLLKLHLDFLKSGRPFHKDEYGRLFVHAGFTFDKPVELTEDPENDYYWSREIYKKSFYQPIMPEEYQEIYIGHTPTTTVSGTPVKNHNVWLMDQGAGWNGCLSMMEINTKKVFQSDSVQELYPDHPGRMGDLGF